MFSISNHRFFLKIGCLLLLACLLVPARAQENAHFESWNTYILRHYTTKHRFWYRTDLGIRPSFDEDRSTMYLLRLRPSFNLGSLVELMPSVDFRYSYYPGSDNTFELRTWQGIRVHWPDINRVMFDHFYRFEQRFHWREGAFERERLSLRSRYRLNMRVPINKRAVADNTFFIDLRGEAFLPHDDGVLETYASTIRVGLNLGYRQNVKWQYELIFYLDGGRNKLDENRSASRYMLEARVRTTL